MALTGEVFAGGVERTSFSSSILFEEGTYAELTIAEVAPNVSGAQGPLPGPLGLVFPQGSSTGDVANDYLTTTIGFKTQLSENLHAAVVLDQPIGADIIYGQPNYLYGFGTGSTAQIFSQAMTAMLRYEFANNISAYGGLRYQQARGEVSLFSFLGQPDYDVTTPFAADWGYVVGAAWEKPEIAARVALSYQSAITHELQASERQGATTANTTFETTVPQALMLEFQTGIAADTLLFGSVKWTDWSAFDITPTLYTNTVGGSLVSYDEDVITYSLGLGRRLTDKLSAAVTVAYEEEQGGFSANLGPTDGFISLGLGATYTIGNMEISGGARYIWIGDAITESPIVAGQTQGTFNDNSGTAFGMKIAYNF